MKVSGPILLIEIGLTFSLIQLVTQDQWSVSNTANGGQDITTSHPIEAICARRPCGETQSVFFLRGRRGIADAGVDIMGILM